MASLLGQLFRAFFSPPKKTKRKAAPKRAPVAVAPKAVKLPALVPRDFIALSEAEALYIVDILSSDIMTGDSRLTLTERMIDCIYEGTPLSTYWDDHPQPDVDALIERLRPIKARQAQAVISAGKRFGKMVVEDGDDELQALRDSGMIA